MAPCDSVAEGDGDPVAVGVGTLVRVSETDAVDDSDGDSDGVGLLLGVAEPLRVDEILRLWLPVRDGVAEGDGDPVPDPVSEGDPDAEDDAVTDALCETEAVWLPLSDIDPL